MMDDEINTMGRADVFVASLKKPLNSLKKHELEVIIMDYYRTGQLSKRKNELVDALKNEGYEEWFNVYRREKNGVFEVLGFDTGLHNGYYCVSVEQKEELQMLFLDDIIRKQEGNFLKVCNRGMIAGEGLMASSLVLIANRINFKT